MNTFLHTSVRRCTAALPFLPLAFAASLVAPSLVAQSLSGRVVSPTGQPIAGIDVDSGGGGGGGANATTDANGLFLLTPLTNQTYDVEYVPPYGGPWAARVIPTNVSGATNIGDIVLQPGFHLSGVAQTSAGAPLAGCNVNVYDQDGVKLFTPHDGTDLLGNFMVMIPAGTWDIRVQPPVATPLVPRQFEDVIATGATSLGMVTLPQGHQVTGSVNDLLNLVPIGLTRIKATDALTGERIVIVNDTANTFGQFSVLLPVGMFDVDFEPPVGNTHTGRRKYGVVVTGPVALGQVRLQNGVLVSGTVVGPGGAISGADIDVRDSFGTKLFTPRDITDATGSFSVAVPTGSGYRVVVEPPVSAGLVGLRTAALTLTGATSLGTLSLSPGTPVVGKFAGFAHEANAQVTFVDNATGDEVVTVGDRTDATGRYTTFLPLGSFAVYVHPQEGSLLSPTRDQLLVVNGNTHVASPRLQEKRLRCTLSSLGTPTLAQGGLLPIDLLIDNRTRATLATTLEVFVSLPSGVELPVLPPMSVAAPPSPLSFNGLGIAVPIVPASDTGKPLRMVVRVRDAVTQSVLDTASTEFVVE